MGDTDPRVNRIWLAIMGAMHERIKQLGMTMEEVDERAGFQERYTAKLLHPATSSGRVARWFFMQVLADTLFPNGFVITLQDAKTSDHAIAIMHRKGKGPTWLTKEYRRAGAKAMWASMSPKEQARVRRNGGRARWRKVNAAERSEFGRRLARARWGEAR